MQITETVSEGLRREYKIVVGVADLEERLTGKIEEIRPRLSLKGFRPGKAPVSFLKKTYGKWLGLIKRSRKEWPQMMEVLSKANSLPDKYNKVGYIINQLKPKKTQKLL